VCVGLKVFFCCVLVCGVFWVAVCCMVFFLGVCFVAVGGLCVI